MVPRHFACPWKLLCALHCASPPLVHMCTHRQSRLSVEASPLPKSPYRKADSRVCEEEGMSGFGTKAH